MKVFPEPNGPTIHNNVCNHNFLNVKQKLNVSLPITKIGGVLQFSAVMAISASFCFGFSRYFEFSGSSHCLYNNQPTGYVLHYLQYIINLMMEHHKNALFIT